MLSLLRGGEGAGPWLGGDAGASSVGGCYGNLYSLVRERKKGVGAVEGRQESKVHRQIQKRRVRYEILSS